MDPSGEVADLIAREALQAGETAVKLAASGVKNVTALLLALANSNYKVVGKTSAKKLAKDPTPSSVMTLRAEDVKQFTDLAKEYGILYMIAHPKGKAGDTVDVISTQRYAAKLNAVYQAMGYPLPEEKTAEAESAKKVQARDPQESVSPERGNGWKAETRETSERGKVPVREKLKALEKTAKELEQRAPVPGKEPVR